jgi:hypothetical protein
LLLHNLAGSRTGSYLALGKEFQQVGNTTDVIEMGMHGQQLGDLRPGVQLGPLPPQIGHCAANPTLHDNGLFLSYYKKMKQMIAQTPYIIG